MGKKSKQAKVKPNAFSDVEPVYADGSKPAPAMKRVYDIDPEVALAIVEQVEVKSTLERMVARNIMDALRQKKPIYMEYTNANGETKLRYVDVGSMARTGKDDLVFNGFDYNRNEMRSFRADRVKAIGIG